MVIYYPIILYVIKIVLHKNVDFPLRRFVLIYLCKFIIKHRSSWLTGSYTSAYFSRYCRIRLYLLQPNRRMASVANATELDSVTCSICKDIFNNPVKISCNHS